MDLVVKKIIVLLRNAFNVYYIHIGDEPLINLPQREVLYLTY